MANNIISALLCFMLATVTLGVFLSLPDFLVDSQFFYVVMGFLPFIFTMLGMIILFKD